MVDKKSMIITICAFRVVAAQSFQKRLKSADISSDGYF